MEFEECKNIDENVNINDTKSILEYIESRLAYFETEICTEEECLLVVKHHGSILEFIHEKNKTDKVCLAAVKQNGIVLKHVKNQTFEICLAAAKQNKEALKYIKDKYMLEYVRDEVLFQNIKSNKDYINKCK